MTAPSITQLTEAPSLKRTAYCRAAIFLHSFTRLVISFLTRVVTFVLGNDGSNRSYREVHVSEGHHDLPHHGNDTAKQEKLRRINRLHVEREALVRLPNEEREQWETFWSDVDALLRRVSKPK